MSTTTSRKRDADHLSNSDIDVKKPKGNGSITSFFGLPKPRTPVAPGLVNTSQTSTSPKFNKARWVAGLTTEQKDLLKLEIETLDESWLAHLKEEVLTKEFLNLKRFLKTEIDSGAQIFPPLGEVYAWYEISGLFRIPDTISLKGNNAN
jgi:hypothetical protein